MKKKRPRIPWKEQSEGKPVLVYCTGPSDEQIVRNNINLYNSLGVWPQSSTRQVTVNELTKEFENQLTENQINTLFDGK